MDGYIFHTSAPSVVVAVIKNIVFHDARVMARFQPQRPWLLPKLVSLPLHLVGIDGTETSGGSCLVAYTNSGLTLVLEDWMKGVPSLASFCYTATTELLHARSGRAEEIHALGVCVKMAQWP